MDILLMMWVSVDVELLIVLLLRKKLTKSEKDMYRRSLEQVNSLGIKLMKGLRQVFWFFFVGLGTYILIHSVSDIIILKLLEWYRGIFIVALFPVFFTWIREKHFKIKSIWNCVLTLLAIFFSILGYIMDIEKIENISENRLELNILMSIFVTSFIMALFEIGRENKAIYSKKLNRKGIRKDLYYRTPELMVNLSKVELIKCCERYFTEYMCRYKKIGEVSTVEYVNLAGIYKKCWYEKSACFIMKFIKLSVMVAIIDINFRLSIKPVIVLVLIFAFEILISLFQHIDLDCLYKMAIRFFYDEWGYYLTGTRCDKFVGTVQFIECSKFHRYIHSFLDIVALCRAVAFNDKITGEKNICIIASNLSDLFVNYSDCKNSKNWVMVIPLWIAALFEFYITDQINDDVKAVLVNFADKRKSINISIFLQSFWADIERKLPKEGVSQYIKLFEEELYN